MNSSLRPVRLEQQCNHDLSLQHFVTAVLSDVRLGVHIPSIKCCCCQCQQSSASPGLRLAKLSPRPTQTY